MNVNVPINEDVFKKKLLSQLSRKSLRSIKKLDVVCDKNYEYRTYDYYGNFESETRTRVCVTIESTDAKIFHGWTFDKNISSCEVRFCLRWIRKTLKKSLK